MSSPCSSNRYEGGLICEMSSTGVAFAIAETKRSIIRCSNHRRMLKGPKGEMESWMPL